MLSVDQLGNEWIFEAPPQRIVSLVPSITELLCDLGLEDRLVGCTKFCVHPLDLRKSKTIIGGTKNIQLDRIKALKPELIIANKEENRKEDVDQLLGIYRCWVSEIKTFSEAEKMIRSLAKIFRRSQLGEQIIARNRLALPDPIPDLGKALYLIWRDPFMSVGRDTYIHDMLSRCGYTNCCADRERYPSLSAQNIADLQPAHILLSSEPFPFKEKHLKELQEICPSATVELVDGEFYSWYGSRLGKLADRADRLGP